MKQSRTSLSHGVIILISAETLSPLAAPWPFDDNLFAHAAATLASQAVIAAAQQNFGDANGLQQRNQKLAAANAKRQKTMAANRDQTPTRSTLVR